MPEPDYVDQLLKATQSSAAISGIGEQRNMDGSEAIEHEIGRLVEIGALTEIGALNLKQVASMGSKAAGGLPAPSFARSARDTERRAPLGFTEDTTGHNFFTLAATVGATTTMRGKVSRVAHVNRLLIIPSVSGQVIITSIKVGDEEQVLASGVPAEIYGTSALTDTEPDNFSPLGPALDFTITLQNTVAAGVTGTIGCKAKCKR